MSEDNYIKEHKERYEKAMRQLNMIDKLSMRDTDVIRPKEIMKQRNISESFGMQDKGLEEYRKETIRIQAKNEAKRSKLYAALNDADMERLRMGAIRTETILDKRKKRQMEIQEKKDRERREQIAEIEREEERKAIEKREMEKESMRLSEIQIGKKEDAIRLAVKVGRLDKIRRDKDYVQRVKKPSNAQEHLELAIKDSNRRKAIDRGELTEEEFAMKYHEGNYNK